MLSARLRPNPCKNEILSRLTAKQQRTSDKKSNKSIRKNKTKHKGKPTA